MFQYATARRMALVNDSPLKLDLSWHANNPPGGTQRQYELLVFNSIQDVASPMEVKVLRGMDIGRWPKVVKRILKTTGLFMKQSCIREKYFHFDPEILGLRGDVHLDGYWQSARYFADVADTIRQDFTFRAAPDPVNREIGEIIRGAEAVSLHVRRGDYVAGKVAAQHHGSCSMEYYKSAIAEMVARLRNPHFFVFSDEPAWVKEHLRLTEQVTYVDHNGPEKGHEDLRLMTLCRHHIIANSSFSWWGAWLPTHAEKIVIAPQKWFNLDDIVTSDLLPENWLRL
jgi:hypothetical protein